MTEQEHKYPTILDMFPSKPASYIRLETRITGARSILFVVEESRDLGRFTFAYPVLGGGIEGVRQAANDIRADRPDVFYNEVILKV